MLLCLAWKNVLEQSLFQEPSFNDSFTFFCYSSVFNAHVSLLMLFSPLCKQKGSKNI